MSFTDAVRACLTKYATFDGRSRRSEYWYFLLFGALVMIVAGIIDSGIGSQLATGLTGLALLVPRIAVGVRRLHDTNRSGWWLLIAFTVIGIIPLIVFMVQDSQPGTNKYGESPKGVTGYPAAYPAV